MKRAGNLWPQAISFSALARAAERARRGKRGRGDVHMRPVTYPLNKSESGW